ncbi:N-acetylneuraminate synthase family protein [Candidatus Woesearchaeota archaeon]|nr:N-acetylneuraminate synthase family protein [Candidatus Woesearchaeota archaeon]
MSLTIPEELNEKISSYVNESSGLILNKTQAVIQAWNFYEKIFLDIKNPEPVKIGNRLIGHKQPVFLIAEIGINHNGDINIAKKLIDLAVNCGWHAVKFQKRNVDVVYSKEDLERARESPFGTTNGDLKRALEFGEREYKEIDEYCKEKGIMWFASPWDVGSVDFLEKFDVPCYKIASATLTNKSLLNKIKETGKPVILSTGMSSMEEIKKALSILGEENLVILHCTSTYPTKLEELNLNVIKTFRKYFNCPIGYSGHETGIMPSVVALALGACVVERHITLDRSMYGSDQAASLEKKGMEYITREAEFLSLYLGDGNKKIFESEKPIIKKLRRVDNL